MTRPGTILRDTNAGTGLLVVDETQLPFRLETMWTAATAPGDSAKRVPQQCQ